VADWILVPCLVQLRTEFNRIAPDRDKTTDGSIGDTAHAAGGNSDHLPDEEFDALHDHDADSKNEVHAIDMDKDLRVPGLTMERVVQHLVNRCRAGAERRLTYIIYNRRIWSASRGWVQRTYAGSNPHDKHAHFSASYTTARESDTSSWHLEDLVALSEAEIKAIAKAVWDHVEPNPYDDGATTRRMGGDLRMLEFRADNRLKSTNGRLDTANTSLAQVLSLVTELAGRDLVDEPAIAAAVRAGLPASAIVAAIPPELAKQVVDELTARLSA
jgi:hypothetical protein